ncbi:MAG TPA: DedA family protein [Verrucomicrobiae bacterium]|nr:DedA family protein [Verrucomicrobiae bacterium]
MKHFITAIIQWYTAHLSYSVLALLMAAESTIFPLPSELIIPPAAASGKFSVIGIVIAGTIGSWVGASIMYWVSRVAGRPLVMRYGGFVGISAKKIEGAERWAGHFGSMGIFISRLLPVVRHLIGIPAGIVRMDYRLFSLFTVLGSGIWCAILCWLGIKMGQDQQLMKGEYHRIVIWVGGVVIVLGSIYYFFVHRQMKALPEK